MDSWSTLIFRRNMSKICLKLVEYINHLSRKKRKGNNFILNSAGKSLANSLFRIFAGVFLCFGNGFSYPCHRLLHFNLNPGRVAQSVTCLATDACLTADPGIASSIPVRSHTFVEIDHEIISTVILLPSADLFKKGCCQLQAKVCARITG